MRSTIILLLLFILSYNHANAQDDRNAIAKCDGGEADYLPFIKDQYYFPAYRKISVYSRPDARSRIFHQTLSYADTLRFVEVMQNYPSKFHNIYGYWCKVAFPLSGKRYFGYVPSQFIARTHIREENITYLVNLETFTGDTFIFSLKILKDLQLVSEYRFAPVANYAYTKFEHDTVGKDYSGYFGIILRNNLGLANVDRTLFVYSGYPACGYWNGSKILMIKDNKILYSIEDGGMVDGSDYAAESYFIFPSDSLGKQDTLIRKWFNYETLTDTTDRTERSTIQYLWTGDNVIKLDSIYTEEFGVPGIP